MENGFGAFDIFDVPRLFEAVKQQAGTQYRLQKELPTHDKTALRRWFEEGATPRESVVVAEVIQLALKLGIDITPFQNFRRLYDLSELLTYEAKAAQGPPDLSWLTAGAEPPIATTEVAGLRVRCPVGIASSPLMGDDRWGGLMLDLGFGLSTFKTRRSGYMHSHDAPQIAVVADELIDLTDYDPANPPRVLVSTTTSPLPAAIQNHVNSMGVPCEKNPFEWQQQYSKLKEHRRAFAVGLSVIADGDSREAALADLQKVLSLAIDVHPPFIELNISCPNLEKRFDLWTDLALLEEMVAVARRKIKGSGIRLFLKVPQLTQVALDSFARRVAVSVDAIVFRNTLRVQPVKVRARDGQEVPAFNDRIFGGLSGPLTFNLTRRGVRHLAKLRKNGTFDAAIIAVGGVSSAEDVITLLNDGADAVQACNAVMYDPLLAWKARFHYNNATTVVVRHSREQLERFTMGSPRDSTEREALECLEAAVREIKRRQQRDVAHVAVVEAWNQYLSTRAPVPDKGLAQRPKSTQPGTRSVAEWIKVLR